MQSASEITVQEATAGEAAMSCRFCGTPVRHTLVDLGMSPLCESYVSPDNANKMEPFYPLHVFVCDRCFLAQLDEFVPCEEIFTEYAYFSSYAESWVEHARRYSEMMIERFGLGGDSLVCELASNDGYLLQHFVRRSVPCYGVEPARNVAKVAIDKGVPTITRFFGVETAKDLAAEGRRADVVLGNNVLAQVPDLNDFIAGIKILMKPGGVMTIEFPHLLRLIRENQFDTIYHEHYCYFSFLTAQTIFAHHGITLFDVEELPTHGGSLRIFGRHADDDSKPPTARVEAMMAMEREAGLDTMDAYRSFTEQVQETKRKILEFLIKARRDGRKVVGYGAPGKGNTLLNYCGVRSDFIEFTVDRNTYKQGKFLPGTRIPIGNPDLIREARPDYLFIRPWNFKDEIMQQMSFIREWGGKFVVPIPEITVYS
jgi:hypothetical protein